MCDRFLRFGGMGHTMSIHSSDEKVIREFALSLPAFRMVVNTPASHGSIGYTTRLFPSMSLGCGTPGGNITTDNIGPMNLLNIKHLAYERRPINPADSDRAGNDNRADAAGAMPRARNEAAQAPPSSAIYPSRAPAKPASRGEVERLVQRFGGLISKPVSPAWPDGTSLAVPSAASPSPVASLSAEVIRSASDTPGASPRPVDFVSEDDVRTALKKGEKIHVGKRTIITPSARDLGEPNEVFIRTD